MLAASKMNKLPPDKGARLKAPVPGPGHGVAKSPAPRNQL